MYQSNIKHKTKRLRNFNNNKKIEVMKELQENIEALTYNDYLQHGKGTPAEFVWTIFEKGVEDHDNVPQSLLDAVSEKETELEGIHESQGLVYTNYYEEYGVSERDFY